MNCYFCQSPAELRCSCSFTYYCSNHIGLHITNSGSHTVEKLDIVLDSDASQQLRKKLLIRLQQISDSKQLIMLNTKKTMILIEKLNNQLIAQLNSLETRYICLLKLSAFAQREMTEVYEILQTQLNIRTIASDVCMNTIEQEYAKGLITVNSTTIEIREKSESIYERKEPNDVWNCVCGSQNFSGYELCQKCWKIKPGLGGWVCTDCRFRNDMNNKICSMCKVESVRMQPRPNNGQPTKIDVPHITCPGCSSINFIEANFCVVCKRNLSISNDPVPQAIERRVRMTKSPLKSSYFQWMCTRCKRINNSSNSCCQTCGH